MVDWNRDTIIAFPELTEEIVELLDVEATYVI
jgi:hypothetical protein